MESTGKIKSVLNAILTAVAGLALPAASVAASVSEPAPYAPAVGIWKAVRVRCASGQPPRGNLLSDEEIFLRFEPDGFYRKLEITNDGCQVRWESRFTQTGGIVATHESIGAAFGTCALPSVRAATEAPTYEMWGRALIFDLGTATKDCLGGSRATMEFHRVTAFSLP